jgi:hypothetical protein
MMNCFCTILLILTLSCSHQQKLNGQLKSDYKHLDHSNSFEFYQNDIPYYFALNFEDQGKTACSSYVGYKNGVLQYKFLPSAFGELNRIYEKKESAELRIAHALREIEIQSKNVKTEECSSNGHWSDGIAWYTLALMVWPVTLMAVGADVINQQTNRLNDVRLGMGIDEVKKLLNVYHMSSRTEGGQDYLLSDYNEHRLVMYFRNDKLHAFVRGQKPRDEGFSFL